jgi:hypothetical protein
MKATSFALLALFSLVGFLLTERLGAEVKLPPATATPAELVKAALQTELDGPSTLRTTLLSDALERDPNFAPARWQSGFIRIDGDWVKIDDVPQRAGADKKLTSYRKLRDAMVDMADNHRALARWCHKNQLLDEERVHWAKVMEFERGDAEALAALGLQLYDGRWLTRAQIDAEKQRAGDRLRAARKWQPQITKWRSAIDHGNAKDRDKALAALRSLNDPAAIPVLESVFAVNADSAKSKELNRLLIETVGRMPHPEATQVLLRRAILPDSPDVRAAAADELKKRPMHVFVPQLIAAFPGSLKTRFHVTVLPGGMVLHEHEFYLEGQKADFAINYESIVNPTDAATAFFVTPRAMSTELASAATLETRANAVQGQADWMRNRVRFALKRTTGFAAGDDPRLWERQYNDYNGWSDPSQAKPVYRQNFSNYQSYFALPPETNIQSTTTLGTRIGTNSCFPAGTMIMTIQGPRPIEELRVGDRVLSQEIGTGELAYRPIQTTTLRPATPVLKVAFADQAILVTPGHPFWVNGLGWRSAKHLLPGMPLHSLDGSMTVESVEAVRATEVYNLVVSEFHNYFLASPRLLVHDNSTIADVPVVIPGLMATDR